MDFIHELKSNPAFKFKFAYASRISSEFYDYYIMPYWLVNQDDYMTISSDRIIHTSKGESVTMELFK